MAGMDSLIEYVRDIVNHNETRARETPDGLTWRSGRLESHLTLSDPWQRNTTEGPTEARVLGAVTPVVNSIADAEAAARVANLLNSKAALSATVWDPQEKTLVLASSFTMHEQNLANIMTWDAAFYLQAYQAERFAEEVADAVGGRPALVPESQRVSEPSLLFKDIGELDLFNFFPFDGQIKNEFEDIQNHLRASGLPVEAGAGGFALKGTMSGLEPFDYPKLERHMGSLAEADFAITALLKGLGPDTPLAWKGPFSYLEAETVQWTGAGLSIDTKLPAIGGVGVHTAQILNGFDLRAHIEDTPEWAAHQLGGWFFDGQRLRHRLFLPSTMLQGRSSVEVSMQIINAFSAEFGRFITVFPFLEDRLS